MCTGRKPWLFDWLIGLCACSGSSHGGFFPLRADLLIVLCFVCSLVADAVLLHPFFVPFCFSLSGFLTLGDLRFHNNACRKVSQYIFVLGCWSIVFYLSASASGLLVNQREKVSIFVVVVITAPATRGSSGWWDTGHGHSSGR